MTLRRGFGVFARAALLVASGTSLFVLVFVVYAHVVSLHDARLMSSSARETHFVSAAAFASQFHADVTPGASYVVDGDALVVRAAGEASADFVGAETRLVDGASLTSFSLAQQRRVRRADRCRCACRNTTRNKLLK